MTALRTEAGGRSGEAPREDQLGKARPDSTRQGEAWHGATWQGETGPNSTRASWTPERIIDALTRYERAYGRVTSACFNPATAKWAARQDLIDRYYGPDGPWPSLNTIRSAFGTFNAARVAAGLTPNKPGPRRKQGEAAPIRDVKVQRVFIPSEAGKNASRRVIAAQERALAAERRADLAIERMRRVEAEHPAEVRTITKVKTRTVRDTRTVERLRAKLADAEAAHRALAEQLRAERKTDARDRAEIENARAEARESAADAKAALDAGKRTSDRLAASVARAERLSDDLDAARAAVAGVRADAVEADLVRKAEARADAAEVRAARAEREMAEQGATVTGEQRRLTADEMTELRRDGPAGPAVMADALKRLARARREAGDLDAALVDVARAAIGWRDVQR